MILKISVWNTTTYLTIIVNNAFSFNYIAFGCIDNHAEKIYITASTYDKRIDIRDKLNPRLEKNLVKIFKMKQGKQINRSKQLLLKNDADLRSIKINIRKTWHIEKEN